MSVSITSGSTGLSTPTLPARTVGVGAWVDIVVPAAKLAKDIADTDFVPKAMRGNPAVVTACILFGAEIGIGPMQSLAKIAIIDGKPAPSAELARALVLSDGHDLWVEEATMTRVIMGGKRANSSHVQKATWTMDDAKKAGLAGKQNWARYPRQMLLARCSIELARMVAPDSLGGISVFAEELDDGVVPSAGGDVIPDVATQVRKASTRKLAAAPPLEPVGLGVAATGTTAEVSLPPLPDEEPPVGKVLATVPVVEVVDVDLPPLPDEETPAPDGPTDAQLRKLMATYNGLGIKDRADQKRVTSGLLDLPSLGSHKDLTVAQTSILIDMLTALGPDDIVIVDGRPYVAGSEPDGELPL